MSAQRKRGRDFAGHNYTIGTRAERSESSWERIARDVDRGYRRFAARYGWDDEGTHPWVARQRAEIAECRAAAEGLT